MRRPARAETPTPVSITPALLGRWPLPPLDGVTDKEGRGRVLVVGGSLEIPGAVVLAAEAALRAGAGKLQIATVDGAAGAVALAVPEAKVMALPSRLGCLADVTDAVVHAAAAADAVVIGCGMEERADTLGVVSRLIAACRGPVVLDAGALAAVHSGRPRAARIALTPHVGEMAALTGGDAAGIAADQAGAAWAFAHANDVALALKGATTIVCEPERGTYAYRRGPVGLGTSGSGDVLAGVIAGLLARGAALAQALAWGVYLHGEAGRRLTRRVGQVGFLAREIAAEIPRVLDRT